MNITTIAAIVLAVVAIALGVWALVALYLVKIKPEQIEGMSDLVTAASLNRTASITNSSKIDSINAQLGTIDVATTGYTALASAAVTPAFPLTL